jgi:hypothetical protein
VYPRADPPRRLTEAILDCAMPSIRTRLMLASLLAILTVPSMGSPLGAAVIVTPPSVLLDSPEATQQLLATIERAGRPVDQTRAARYTSANPSVVGVDATGLLTPHGEGHSEIIVQLGTETVRIPVEVAGFTRPAPVSFEHQVIPILTKATCNSGGCHGKAEGQNGFKLSVFGSDPKADHHSLTAEARGRRVFPAAVESSLLLLKAAARMPHGGGKKIDPGSLPYRRLRRWIEEGGRLESPAAAAVVALEVEPSERVLVLRGTQQLRVTAIDAAGRRHCVTTEAEYHSNALPIAAVDRRGWIEAGDVPGEAAILVRYLDHVTACRITLPRPGVSFPRPPEANFIDSHVWDKLQRLGIVPSEPVDDAAFLRRVYLDAIGVLPTAAEARAFLASTDPRKRADAIDRLLERPEYADYWAMIWADLLRLDKDLITPRGAIAMSRWLRRQFAENRPYDEFARDVVTARGSTAREGPAAFYVVMDSPEAAARSVAQVFLGVRIACAQCHHHPSARWGQEDYFGLAGFFTSVARKKLPGGTDAIFATAGADLQHPRTAAVVPARALAAAPARFTDRTDRRTVLAEWMTAPDNPCFAKAIANRLWAHYFGRGVVEPIDDLRATNPATNEPLLAELTRHVRDMKYDLKAVTRTLLNSRAYQLSAGVNGSNAEDVQHFSHATIKAMPAEVLLDAISQVTGMPEKFNGWPEGYRAVQVWDNRMPSYFFRIFGRPMRASVCECERSNEPSVTQALHLMNSAEISDKIRSRSGTARRLAESKRTPAEIIEELYLSALSRLPTAREKEVLLPAFAADADRRTATEDVLWTLLNSKEFLYNH